MLGAVGAWVCATLIPGPPWIGFVVALVLVPLVVGALSVAADYGILKRIDYNPEATIVATIGLLYIFQQVTLMTFGPNAQAVDAPFHYTIRFPWFGYSSYKLFIIVVAIVLVLVLWRLLKGSKIGLLMRATQYDKETAQNFGIPVAQVYSAVFAVGAMLAAIAGVLVVPNQQAHYLMGHDPLLLSFVVVIVGGLGVDPRHNRGRVFHRHVRWLSVGLLRFPPWPRSPRPCWWHWS